MTRAASRSACLPRQGRERGSSAGGRSGSVPVPDGSARTAASPCERFGGRASRGIRLEKPPRYEPGAEYRLHTDTIPAFNELAPGGRHATVLLYLDAPDAGGATVFPALGLAVAPEPGTAIYFRNAVEPVSDPFAMDPHPDAAHAGAPVRAGAKTIATKWFHPVPFPDGPDDGRS